MIRPKEISFFNPTLTFSHHLFFSKSQSCLPSLKTEERFLESQKFFQSRVARIVQSQIQQDVEDRFHSREGQRKLACHRLQSHVQNDHFERNDFVMLVFWNAGLDSIFCTFLSIRFELLVRSFILNCYISFRYFY